MKRVKAVLVDEQQTVPQTRDDTKRRSSNKSKTMKTLTKLALAAVMLTTTCAARADWVNGHFRANGTYVMPYYRTPANGIPYDNLSYRG